MFHEHLRRMCVLLHLDGMSEDINELAISCNVSFKTCVYLSIFCFDDLSLGVTGVLKSPTIIMLLPIPLFMSVSVCLMY